MELPKLQKKVTPRVREILIKKVFEILKNENREYVLPKDVFIAVLEDPGNFGCQIFVSLKLNIKEIINEVKEITIKREGIISEKELNEPFCDLIKTAEKICKELNKRQIGSEHLVLSILRYSGKYQEILFIKQLLKKYGVDYASYYEALVSTLNNDINISKNAENKNTKNNNEQKEDPKNFQEIVKNLFETGVLRNLNEYALSKNEKIIGRESEISKCIRVLCRKKKGNPIIIGEPGVGKTSIAEAIAKAIVEQNVPNKMSNVVIYEIAIGGIVAGTKYRGQFEEKMINVLNFFTKKENGSEKIAFIDEIHHLIKAGSAEGAVDASFLLKPKLADGTFRCIGATTYEDYRKFILSDQALSRRFRPIFIKEPSKEQTLEILTKVKNEYEDFHKIKISDDCIKRIVELTDVYVKEKFFPDKALDILDESCAECIMEKSKSIDYIPILENRIIEEVISNMTGVPITTVCGDEKDRLKNLEIDLKKEIIGQDYSVESVCNSIKRSRLGFKNKNKPIGCFLFIGKTGSGKTLLAKKISEKMFGENKLIRLDMSEYMEKHTMSRIIGAAPGYVGYESGGQLTEQVRNNPYSVILLDEIEKAHPDISNLFLQVLDEGRLTDSFGRVTDFRNTVIIMTSNLSSAKAEKSNSKIGFALNNENVNSEDIEKFLKAEAEKYFPPEFINRLDDIIVFKKFKKEDIDKIFDIELSKTISRLAENGFSIGVTESARSYLLEEGYDEKFGARPISRALSKFIETPLANAYFANKICKEKKVIIDFEEKKIKIKNEE